MGRSALPIARHPAVTAAFRAAILTLAGLIVASPVRAQLRISPVLLPPVNVGCRASAGRADRPGWTEAARVAIGGVASGSPLLRVVAAGPEISLRFPAASPPLAVRISAKAPLDGEFTPICTVPNWRPARAPRLTARASNLLNGSVWRVDVRPLAAVARDAAPIVVERRSGADHDPEVSLSGSDWETAFGWLCLAQPPVADRARRRPTGFAGRVALEVDVGRDALTGGPDQIAALDQDVLRAAGLWTTACRGCRLGQLVVVRIDGAVWLRGGVLQWYDETFGRATPALPAAEAGLVSALEPDFELAAGDPSTRSAKRLRPYEAVADPAARMPALCALKSGPDTAVLARVRAAICDPHGLVDADVARIAVRFRPTGVTWCGSTPDIIGCRASQTLTEFNTRDYRFILGDVDHHTIGGGSTEAPFVLVLSHEMGHWIGLPHIDGGASLMGSALTTARCIDDRTVAKLSSGQGQPWVGSSAFRLRPLPGRR